MTMHAQALVRQGGVLSLPETVRPMELVDGEVVMAPSPSFWHQEVLARMFVALRSWATTRPESPTIIQSPMDVRFAPARILQPDAMVFLEPLPREVAAPIEQIPELCVEVLSTNRTYDRVTKRFLYAEAGVREYWIVDPRGVIERRTGPGLAQVEELDTLLTSVLLPGFELDIRALFA